MSSNPPDISGSLISSLIYNIYDSLYAQLVSSACRYHNEMNFHGHLSCKFHIYRNEMVFSRRSHPRKDYILSKNTQRTLSCILHSYKIVLVSEYCHNFNTIFFVCFSYQSYVMTWNLRRPYYDTPIHYGKFYNDKTFYILYTILCTFFYNVYTQI